MWHYFKFLLNAFLFFYYIHGVLNKNDIKKNIHPSIQPSIQLSIYNAYLFSRGIDCHILLLAMKYRPQSIQYIMVCISDLMSDSLLVFH